jgi:hypothetical protein
MANYINNLSYEQYMKEGLMMLSSHLALKTYKRAGADPSLKATFDKEKDYRVLFQWKGEVIEGSQFIVDRQFWRMSNRNNDDRKYMRRWADPKLNAVSDAIKRGKKKKNG